VENHHAIKNGKPSISMGHLFHGYVSHNQRVGDLLNMWICPGVISSVFFHVDYGMILPRWRFYSVKNEDTAPAVMNL